MRAFSFQEAARWSSGFTPSPHGKEVLGSNPSLSFLCRVLVSHCNLGTKEFSLTHVLSSSPTWAESTCT